MALDFDLFRVVEVKNPSKSATEIYFSDGKANDLKKTSMILFEQQIKYIVSEEYETYKRVKVFIIDDDDPIVIDFYPEEYPLFEAFFMSLYNTDV
ncbi:MAG: hypothetical protein WCH65_07770 [bacterium]